MGKLLYILFIRLYPVAAGLLSVFNQKAKRWIEGRKNIFDVISKRLSGDTQQKIWMHCSSLGEFEQGLPVIKKIKETYVDHSIVLTFFSPSGYEPEKNNRYADHVFYLPMDSKKNATRFFDLIRPRMVLFVKYEFWYYYLSEAKKREISLLLISAIFRNEQPFFKWYGNFHREMLSCFTHFFVQHEHDLRLLSSIDFLNATVTGDTRFDRVLELPEQFQPVPGIELFCKSKPVIVAGSTWLEDDEELRHFVNTHPEYRFIIAPHEIAENRLKECEGLYKNTMRYSLFRQSKSEDTAENAYVLLIDNIGTLKYLYKYATICYIGGGFGGDGVHNVLEGAVYGKPVIFGPVYNKFIEAVELVQHEGAFSVEDALELEAVINKLLSDKRYYKETADAAGNYVMEQTGATKKIMEYIQANRLLTN